MSEAEIYRLATLPPDQFEHREWVALAYARDWALFQGPPPDQELTAEFERLYSEEQRHSIQAWITAANFANRFNNSFSKPLKLPQAYSPSENPAAGKSESE